MGCQLSKGTNASHFQADQLDDSIHAMFSKEARQAVERGENPHFRYRRRATHPLLRRGVHDDSFATVASVSSTACSVQEDTLEVRQLLFHTKHHCDTVDRRDVRIG